MAEITRTWLKDKRDYLRSEMVRLQGAMDMLDAIEQELFPADALTLDQLKDLTGAAEIGEPEEVQCSG